MEYIHNYCVTIDLISYRCSPWGNHMDYFFILLHISNGSVSTSLVGHVLYLADLISAICIPHILLMVHRYIYSRYSPVFPMLYQLYHSLPSSTLISFSSLYLKLQPELLLKVVTYWGWDQHKFQTTDGKQLWCFPSDLGALSLTDYFSTVLLSNMLTCSQIQFMYNHNLFTDQWKTWLDNYMQRLSQHIVIQSGLLLICRRLWLYMNWIWEQT